MDERTATQLAAAQIVDQLGRPAAFMIALRLMQVIAERTNPPTTELVEAFAASLKAMESFAIAAGLPQEELGAAGSAAAPDAHAAPSGTDDHRARSGGTGDGPGADDGSSGPGNGAGAAPAGGRGKPNGGGRLA